MVNVKLETEDLETLKNLLSAELVKNSCGDYLPPKVHNYYKNLLEKLKNASHL